MITSEYCADDGALQRMDERAPLRRSARLPVPERLNCAPTAARLLRLEAYATLNHVAYADLAFLARFTGDPPVVPELGVDLFGGFAALRRERESLDARLIAWSAQR